MESTMSHIDDRLEARLRCAHEIGMALAVWAELTPERIAIHEPNGRQHSFGKINSSANKLTRCLRSRGLKAGDAVALICSNRAEFVEVFAACLRGGWRMTPINWHLSSDEIGYVLHDCDAKAVICEPRTPACAQAVVEAATNLVRLSIGMSIEGCQPYETALADQQGDDIPDPVLGNIMLYTSGTTGRPKGVLKPQFELETRDLYDSRRYDGTSVQLCAGPAYHAAPLGADVKPVLRAGVPLIFLDKWDSETTLRTISERRASHMHLVPIMFQRLLSLPAEIKAKYDVSHVRMILHGAAPCPPDVKQAMIDWFGPVLLEYYGASEGGAPYLINSHEWLAKPGSVGKRPAQPWSKALDDADKECEPYQSGTIYHQLPADGGFVYYKDPEKTRSKRKGNYFTLGDVGYFDGDDFLFLTGRDAETIISGGVNIYPQEIDNVLIKHPSVADSATVGVPHDEWGEQVRAVVLLKHGFEPTDDLRSELIAFARSQLATYKAPGHVDFVIELPRSEAGKVQRNKVRERYWAGRARQI